MHPGVNVATSGSVNITTGLFRLLNQWCNDVRLDSSSVIMSPDVTS